MTGNKDYVNKWDTMINNNERVDYIPKFRGSENPIRKKFLFFLGNLDIGEIRKLNCTSIAERNTISQKMRYYAADILPKRFYITGREDDGQYVYVQRKENVELPNET